MAKYPDSYFDDLYWDYTKWGDQSFGYAQSYVYSNIEENTVPSDEYIQGGIEIAEQQLCRAGYRLAITLLNMWDEGWNSASEATEFS